MESPSPSGEGENAEPDCTILMGPSGPSLGQGPACTAKLGQLSILGKADDGSFRYEAETTQFKEGGDSACSAISFVSMYYMNEFTDPSELLKDMPWKDTIRDGCSIYKMWRSEIRGTSRESEGSYSSLDDILQIKDINTLIKDLGQLVAANGPLYYVLSAGYNEQERTMWPVLEDKLKQIGSVADKVTVGVITISVFTFSIWAKNGVFIIFDSHGATSASSKATVDVVTGHKAAASKLIRLALQPEYEDIEKPEFYFSTMGMSSSQYTLYYTFDPAKKTQ